MDIANNWKDYELIDAGSYEKLERWGNIILIRPDPQIIWKEKSFESKWKTKMWLMIVLQRGVSQIFIHFRGGLHG